MEVEDDHVRAMRQTHRQVLPAGAASLLMTEAEYLEEPAALPREGESSNKVNKDTRKPIKNNKCDAETHKKCTADPKKEHSIPNKANTKPNKHAQTMHSVQVNTPQSTRASYSTTKQYCEATSSRVKVEDMIYTDGKPRTMWERPIPKPVLAWVNDPNMTVEWNLIMNYATSVSKQMSGNGSVYRTAEPGEISDAVEFDTIYPRAKKIRSKGTKVGNPKVTVRLNLPPGDIENIRALKQRYEGSINRSARTNRGTARETMRATRETRNNEKPEHNMINLDQIRNTWKEDYADMVNGTPNKLPPLRDINHEIHIVDPGLRYTYHAPRCPNALRSDFYEKLNRYIDSGWWKESTSVQAAPLMCIPKKDGRLRTVVDCRQRNDNSVKDVTPLPDQEVIREDVAKARYRSKIDLVDAYEQVRIRPEDVPKTAFSTIAGTYTSNIMQQGDCNAPATFQRLMTYIFRDCIG